MRKYDVEERIHTENYMFARHLFAYEVAARFMTRGSLAVDLGCGDGYGVRYLTERGGRAVGVDRDEESLAPASARYRGPGRLFVRATVDRLPIPDSSVNLACSMQVLEHLADPRQYMAEMRRILKDGATLVLSTPYRDSRAWRFDRARSPYHEIEYDHHGLAELASRHFSRVTVQGVRFRQESAAGHSDRTLGLVQKIDGWNIRRFVPQPLKARLYRMLRFQPVGGIVMATADFELVDEIDSEVLDLIAICHS